MKNCTECKHANWKRTDSGKLHPSGDGRCCFPFELPVLPRAFYWIGRAPRPAGGPINRRTELVERCTYWERKE